MARAVGRDVARAVVRWREVRGTGCGEGWREGWREGCGEGCHQYLGAVATALQKGRRPCRFGSRITIEPRQGSADTSTPSVVTVPEQSQLGWLVCEWLMWIAHVWMAHVS